MAGSTTSETGATERQCAVTRIVRPLDELIRFVLDPEGRVVPDLKRRLPGRGAWVTAAADTVAQAAAKGAFARAFRQPVKVDPDLAGLVEGLMEKAALGALSLANKAGQAIVGFVKVETAIAAGEVVALVHASEAAPDGRRKLDGKLARIRPEAPVIGGFNGEQLSLALGRPNVVHAAVTDGGASAGFLGAAARLERFRTGSAAFAAA